MAAIFIGNSKAYLSAEQTLALIEEVTTRGITKPFVFAPASEVLEQCVPHVQGTNIALALQNIAAPGISLEKIAACGVTIAIVGHSDRRAEGLSDEEIAAYMVAVLDNGLTPVLCVGESKEVREKNLAIDFVLSQTREDLKKVETDQYNRAILAYEPIWAISQDGKGIAATPDDVIPVLTALKKEYPHTKILYGGSVTPENISSFLEAGFDGVLVGKASTVIESLEGMLAKIS